MEFGLNLYSIRTNVDTPVKFLNTAAKLKEMGYDALQCSGCPYIVDMFKQATINTGMPIVLTHVPYDRIVNETDKLMLEHEEFGCRNIGIGGIKTDDDAAVREQVEKLNAAAEKMSTNGFKFFYHNHAHEFRAMADGRLVYDYMIEEAGAFNFTFDTYWADYAGANLAEYIKKLDNKIECVHLKDGKIAADGSKSIAPVSEGVLDFKALVPMMEKSGTKHFIVEQDNAADTPDPLGQVNISINYLRKTFG